MLIAMMIVIGAAITRTFHFNEDTRALFISLIVNVAMPCIILSSIFSVDMNAQRFKMILLVFIISIIINLLGIFVGWLLTGIFYKGTKKRSELAIMSGLGNTGFIGIPLCAVLLGPEGALYAAIFDAGVDFTIWTVGVFMLQKKKSFSIRMLREMVNIPMGAIVLGLTLSYFQARPPAIFVNLIDQLSALAAPLAMFYIGVLIMSIQKSKVKETGFKIWLPITTKLIVVPLIASALMLLFNLQFPLVETVLIQSMMPTITLASILFAKYSADEEMGAMTTIVSTILSLMTIPLMIYIVNLLF